MKRVQLQAGHVIRPDRGLAAVEGGYEVQKALEAGGFGITYDALKAPGGADVSANLWLQTHHRVAVKEFFPDAPVAWRRGYEVVPNEGEEGAEELFHGTFERFRREAERLCFLTCLRALRAAMTVSSSDPADQDMRRKIAGRIGEGIDSKFSRDPGMALRLVGQLGGPLRDAAKAAIATAPLPIVYDFFVSQGTAYYVMEFLEGGTLKSRLAEARKAQGTRNIRVGDVEYRVTDPWPVDRLRRFIAAALDALEELHVGIPGQQLIHCDLKPGNIMFRSPQSEEPVLIDFGLARNTIGDASSMALGGGTVGFAPAEIDPESGGHASSSRRGANAGVGPWTDIYSLAVILRVLASGMEGRAVPSAFSRRIARLDRDSDPMDLLPPMSSALPPHMADAIRVGLAYEARDRPQSIAEWRRAFQLAEPIKSTSTTSWSLSVPDSDEDTIDVQDDRTRVQPNQPPPVSRSPSNTGSVVSGDRPLAPRRGLTTNQLLGVVIGAVVVGLLAAMLIMFSGGEKTPVADILNDSEDSPSNLTDNNMTDTVRQSPPSPSPSPYLSSHVIVPTDTSGSAQPKVFAPPAISTPSPQPPPTAVAPKTLPRTYSFSGLGLVVRTISDPSRIAQMSLGDGNPNDPVDVVRTTNDVKIDMGEVFVSACDGGSALRELNSAENGARACLKTESEKTVRIN